MKYTIEGFQQSVLIKYGLNETDAVILRFIVDFWLTGKMKSPIDGWFWLNYGTIIKELPILKQKKQALAKRLKKFTACGLLKFKLLKHPGGTYTLFQFDPEKYENLVSAPTRTKVLVGVASASRNPLPTNTKVRTPTHTKVRPIDSSTKENSNTEGDLIF